MAKVSDRWHRTVTQPDGTKTRERSDRYGKGKRWLVRWYEPDGRERKLSFVKRSDADSHAATVEADMLRGSYIDVRAGREPFGSYALRWLDDQTTDPATIDVMRGRIRRYVEPDRLYGTPLGKVKPSTLQAWLRSLDVSESTKQVVFAHVSAILSAAVDDELIAKNPAKASSVRKPRADPRKVVPWSREWVAVMRAELPERYRVLVALAGGVGLRQGEAFALAPDDVDFLRGWVTVRRQAKYVGSRLVFGPPKGRKTRSVPLPSSVRDELAAHLAAYPARSVSLPWERPDGKATSAELIVSTSAGGVCQRPRFNASVWRPARDRAGIPASRDNGMHALRHYYASVLLDAGESIKAVSEYLGHSSAAFTLATYTHLMSSSEERTRAAVDAAWCAPSAPQDHQKGGVTREMN